MKLVIQNPKKILNKAYLKEKVLRSDIDLLKSNLNRFFAKIDEDESEEHLKNLTTEFLRDTWYGDTYEINTKDRKDLVIHEGKTSKTPVAVVIEVKRPSNKSEMVSKVKPNTKALHELILYYLRERLDLQQSSVKHLIITNIYEWFIFDEKWFEKNIYRSHRLKKEYEGWQSSGKDTKFFYDTILKTFLEDQDETLTCAYFDLREFHALNASTDDTIFIPLYKILSPVNLLKLPFANDSNSLNKKFYEELLYIIGLEEKEKLIKRKERPEPASLLENTIIKLEDGSRLRNLTNLNTFGKTKDDQLFTLGLELTITWINRILFTKLLEAQLFRYHRGDGRFLFLNIGFIHDFSELNNLFFQVLAEPTSSRRAHIQNKFQRVPYLNSSLFESTELEKLLIEINTLDNRLVLPIHRHTVLKDDKGVTKTGGLTTLQYLFEFLSAYDFTSEGPEAIQDDSKNLISASVLGLIFEKINGYKDGSIYTPGFITTYICSETIRNAVLKKMNEGLSIQCDSFSDLKNYISGHYKTGDIMKFNSIVDSIKICDPAVGSGHFLVSALNELIAIKAELGILSDGDGLRLTGYEIRNENDDLIITYNDNTEIYEYVVHSQKVPRDIQRVQKTIFHQKEFLIENCLFGVDVNPNSVKICRLRLWIELLKSAYFTEESGFTELETLPNIDINIKCGDSLISRFELSSNLDKSLKSNDSSVETYRELVSKYRNASNKAEKQELLALIEDIKTDYRTHIGRDNTEQKKLDRLQQQINNKYYSTHLFSESLTASQKEDKQKLEREITRQKNKIESVRNNVIYQQAFEWRFEFPEVLTNDGDFIGFDVIIGNPPFIFGGNEGISVQDKNYFASTYESGKGKINLFTLFIERAFELLRNNGDFAFIIPNTFLRVTSYQTSRQLLLERQSIRIIKDVGDSVFEDAITTAVIIIAEKKPVSSKHSISVFTENGQNNFLSQVELKKTNYVIAINIDEDVKRVLDRLVENTIPLGTICEEMIFGVVITKNKSEIVSKTKHKNWKPFIEGKDIGPYFIKPIHSYLNYDPSLLHRARTPKIFEVPEKIVIQRITGGNMPLKAAYDNHQLYNKESINNIILKEDSGYLPKFVLVLLNSKLLNWFYAKQFTNDSRLTVNLSKEYLSQIPLVKTPIEIQRTFALVADYITAVHLIETPINEFIGNEQLIRQFEDIADAITFELYFKPDFEKAELSIARHIPEYFFSVTLSNPEQAAPIIEKTHQLLRDKENPIRNALKLMDIRLSELIMPIKKP
jgi:adenine-specific DNA-methyltransferase